MYYYYTVLYLYYIYPVPCTYSSEKISDSYIIITAVCVCGCVCRHVCEHVCRSVCVCWGEISDVYVGMQISGHTRESLILSVYG